MVRRSTIIVIIIFIILVFTAWYLQSNESSESGELLPTSTPVINLFELNSESLLKIQIEQTGGARLAMERNEEGIWSFIEPADEEIDQVKAQSVADGILSLSALAKMEKSPSLELMGLDKPAYRITLTSISGEEFILLTGNLTSTNSGYYVSRMGQIPVIVSKSSLERILDNIESPPIYITPTPTIAPLVIETQSPQVTQTP